MSAGNDMAFPVLDRDQTPNSTYQLGLTKREYIAVELTKAVLVNAQAGSTEHIPEMLRATASFGLQAADALIAELDKPLPDPELLAACKAQHEAIDRLFAMLIEATKDREPHCFFPSESGQPWRAVLMGKAAIDKAERRS